MTIHVAAVSGYDLFNLDKPMHETNKTLCGLDYDVTASDGGYVYPSVQGLVYCCGKHEPCEGGSTVSFDSVQSNTAVCRGCIEEIEKRGLIARPFKSEWVNELARVERQIDRCRGVVSTLTELLTCSTDTETGHDAAYDLDSKIRIALQKEAGKLLALLAREDELTEVETRLTSSSP